MDEPTPPPPPVESSPPPPPPPAASGSPTDFLKGVVGKRVVVRLTSGVDYKGLLSCLDGYMNIALEQTEEYVGGAVTNRYGDAFIRGNNALLSISSHRHHKGSATPRQLEAAEESRLSRCPKKANQLDAYMSGRQYKVHVPETILDLEHSSWL
ncbi:hypothetical protein PHLCEN_2v1462 [Hermanssonia centrifuga]|uniref:U6 snRNA-associated Sm-like protein LSm6 n=1 Tax=Hermanssonia centrifuga TaxID=98765 RepID=A0A2R6RZX8_9APHY|nr:hypothetical protein PHLCEN_2v1462 [Hermanssonia centrifuga]